jgi:DMSO/TMAO reductase YedYZ molybdopterin-dependent catalytic subunit
MSGPLPPGQRAIADFPRFGVLRYASRLPDVPLDFGVALEGLGPQGAKTASLSLQELATLERRELVADFHCVTTWTRQDLAWSGFPFRHVYERFLVPRVGGGPGLDYVEFAGLDGYTNSILLDDLLEDDVLLADRLAGEPIPLDHGAPLRLVVPKLYGYKSVKHVSAIRLRADFHRGYAERLTRAHARARVALEERGRGLPGVVYRALYRSFIPLTRWVYRRAAERRARPR